jgi:hypothetical protein
METIIVILAVLCIIECAVILKQFGEIGDAIKELQRLQIRSAKLQEINEQLKDYKALYQIHLKNEMGRLNTSFDQEEYDLMVERGTKAWSDVDDPAEWVSEVRGRNQYE